MELRPPLILSLCLISFYCPARNEFGTLEEAKAAHPEYFKPGVALTAMRRGEPWYVCCGKAERCFAQETDVDLYDEAEIQAKCHLHGYFSGTNRGAVVSASGTRRMYQWGDGKSCYVVIGGPRSGISVSFQSPSHGEEGSRKKLVSRLADCQGRIKGCPSSVNLRLQMARISARKGDVSQACRTYAEAVRIILADASSGKEEKAAVLREVADYEAEAGSGGLALKYFRLLQRSGVPEQAKYATERISCLLLNYR